MLDDSVVAEVEAAGPTGMDELIEAHAEAVREAQRLEADAARVETALAELRNRLAEAEAKSATDDVGAGLLDELVDGKAPAAGDDEQLLRAHIERQKIVSAIDLAERRLDATRAEAARAKAQVAGRIDDIAQHEAQEAARALLAAWPFYLRAWLKYQAAADVAGWYVTTGAVETVEVDGGKHGVARVSDILVVDADLVRLIDDTRAARLRRAA